MQSEELFSLNDLCLRVQDMYQRLSRGLPALDKPPVSVSQAPPLLVSVCTACCSGASSQACTTTAADLGHAAAAAADVPLLRLLPGGAGAGTFSLMILVVRRMGGHFDDSTKFLSHELE